MNASVKTRPLIIAIGNPLRKDDGLGWIVAENLSQARDMDCDIRTVHQLTPELAQYIAIATLVIMIDASREGEPGELCIRPISPSTQPGAVGTHHMLPEEIATLAVVVYGRCPPMHIVTMTGADFGLGEQLSPLVTQNLHRVSTAIHQLMQSHEWAGAYTACFSTMYVPE